MRTILIWTPVYLALFFGLIAGIAYTVFILPATLGGFMGYINTYLIPGGGIGLIVLIAWGLTVWYEKRVNNKESLEAKEARHEAGNYTLAETGSQWVGALHDKTCPLITVVDEPVAKKVVVEPTPPNPSPVDTDDAASADTEPPEELGEIKEFVGEVTAISPFFNAFLARWLPSFWPLAGMAFATAVVVGINIGMANLMEHEPVVFQKAECAASYNVELSSGRIVCGEYGMTIEWRDTVRFINDTVILKKKPYCSVEKGTYTEDTKFFCEYK